MFLWSRLVAIAIWVSIFLFFSIYASANEQKKTILPSAFVYRVFYHDINTTVPAGTAFKMIFHNRYIMVSAAHVCEVVQSKDGTVSALIEIGNVLYSSKVLKIDKNADICLLLVPRVIRNGKGLKLSEEPLVINDIVNIIGFPHGQFKIHVYSRYIRDDVSGFMIQSPDYPYVNKKLNVINFTGIPGQSGGPALNEQNEVVGVLVIASPTESMIVPLSDLTKFLKKSYPIPLI